MKKKIIIKYVVFVVNIICFCAIINTIISCMGFLSSLKIVLPAIILFSTNMAVLISFKVDNNREK